MGNLAEAYTEFGVTGLATVQAAVNKVGSMLGGLSGGALAALGIGAGITAIGTAAVKAFAESEAAEVGLRAALAATGQEVDGNLAKFSELANKLQQVTLQDDEATLALAKTATNLGLGADEAVKFTQAAVGLAGSGLISAEDALVALTKEANGMKSSFSKLYPQLAGVTDQTERMAIISELAEQGMEQQFQAADTLSGTWEHLQQTVGNLMEVLGGVLAPVLEVLVGWVQNNIDWWTQMITTIQDVSSTSDMEFGAMGGIVNWLGETWMTVVNFIRTAIEGVVVAVMNWKTIVAIAGNNIALSFSKLMDVMSALWENTKIGLAWFGEHWKEVFTDIGNFVIVVMTNLASNVKLAWDKLAGIITGDTTKAQFKSLTEGFQSAITKSPEFKAVVKSDMTKGLEENGKQLNEKLQTAANNFHETFEKNAKPEAEKLKNELANIGKLDIQKDKKGKTKKEKEDGGMVAIMDVWKKAQENLLKKQDKVPEAQLAEQKKANENGKEMVTSLKEISKKMMVAT